MVLKVSQVHVYFVIRDLEALQHCVNGCVEYLTQQRTLSFTSS